MKLYRYVDHQRLHIVTKDVISLSISVLLLFRHYISHKITFGSPSSGGVLCSACGAFIADCSEVCSGIVILGLVLSLVFTQKSRTTDLNHIHWTDQVSLYKHLICRPRV